MPDALDTDKLRELLEKATPGPWDGGAWGIDGGAHGCETVVGIEEAGSGWNSYRVLEMREPDAALIVALRNAAPALLALAARAERMEAALREIASQGCEDGRDEPCTAFQSLDRSEWCDRCLAQDGLNKAAALPAADRRAENDKHE